MARKDPSSPAREVRDISLKFNSILIISLDSKSPMMEKGLQNLEQLRKRFF